MSALTRGVPYTISGTVGTAVISVLGPQTAINFLRVHNPSFTATIACTYDNVTNPVINTVGITLGPGATDTWDTFIPNTTVKIVGSNAGAPYTIMYY